jgi:hypothetical protein
VAAAPEILQILATDFLRERLIGRDLFVLTEASVIGPCKFDELREKTSQQLKQVLDHELEQGILAASGALSREARSFSEAKEIHARVARLLPLAYDLSGEERRRLESKLERLDALLSGGGMMPSGCREPFAVCAGR